MLLTSVHFLFLVFLGMLSLVLLLIIVVLFYSFFQYKESVRSSSWLDIINKKISETIVYEEDEIPSDQNFVALSGDTSFRNMFLKKLVDSEKKFSGAAKNKLNSLFTRYDLQKEAIKKLDQKKPHLITGGIQELTVMDAKESLPKIARFLTHSHQQVYQEAQYAMVRLQGFEGLDFLNTVSSKISEWQQLRLLLSIKSIPENSDAAIKNWLESENDSVIIFSLKLLKKFQLLSLYPPVLNLLNHASAEVRVQAVKAMQSLENFSTVTSLTEAYPEQPLEVRLEILKVIKSSKDQSCTDLLKQELSESTSTGIKVHAAEALFLLGHHEYLSKMAQEESSSEELVQIIKYAMQEKVC